LKINIPDWAWDHFWEEEPEGTVEFWAFRFRPPCKVRDDLIFCYRGMPVAKAKVFKIEPPGVSECEATGRFKNRWKVFWLPQSFVDLRKQERLYG